MSIVFLYNSVIDHKAEITSETFKWQISC